MTWLQHLKNMQEEAFRIQKDMYIRIKDFQLLGLDETQIRKILQTLVYQEELRVI